MVFVDELMSLFNVKAKKGKVKIKLKFLDVIVDVVMVNLMFILVNEKLKYEIEVYEVLKCVMVLFEEEIKCLKSFA